MRSDYLLNEDEQVFQLLRVEFDRSCSDDRVNVLHNRTRLVALRIQQPAYSDLHSTAIAIQ